MKLLVGLGNPGDKYRATRHNVGFMVVDELARRHRIQVKKRGYQGFYGVGRLETEQATLLLPQTFMNRSGVSVNAAYQSLGLGPEDLIVVYDDLDLPFGRLRIRDGGGHGGHNGLKDIVAVLGSRDFVRLRVGIGRPEHDNITAHVLSGFSGTEQKQLPRLLEGAVAALETILRDGVSVGMNKFNNFNLED